MIIGKTFTFESAHCLPGHEKCGQVHGHTYTLTVEVIGDPDPETGMVVDFHALSDRVKAVTSKLDHKYLNDVVTVLPTCEELAELILDLLELDVPGLHSVTLQEGEGGYAKIQR